MSAKTTGTIWDLAISVPWRMVLLAMVDHADHNGEHMRASQAFIAWKTGYSSRNVARIIQELLGEGILVQTAEALGEENEYRFNLSKARLKQPFRGRKPKKAGTTPDKMSGVKRRTPDILSGANNETHDNLSHPPDKLSYPTHDMLAIDHDSLYMNHESPTPTAHESRNGGGGDFFRELRRRGVGKRKAEEIAATRNDPERVLHLIDTRPNACAPSSPEFGRLINDILDNVAGDYVAPARAVAAPAAPPAPRAGLSADELRALKDKHNPFERNV